MSFEAPGRGNEVTKEEAGELYDSLPEGMKTGHYGVEPQEETFSDRERAGDDALPHVIVTFADGRKLSLHLNLKEGVSFEKQVERIKQAAQDEEKIKDVHLVWQRNPQ